MPSHALEEVETLEQDGEDEDDLLLNSDLETLTNSIRSALLSNLPAETTRHATALHSEERRHGGADHSEEDNDEDGSEVVEEEVATVAGHPQANMGVIHSGRIMRWRPRVEVPKLKTTREVHQRAAAPVEKESGLSKQVSRLPFAP
jgi:hypothetical protein